MLILPETSVSDSPESTFEIGRLVGSYIGPGDTVLLTGGLGAGKTLLTKGIVDSLGFDIDEVTSPSFTLVNLYRASNIDIYHIDLWRLDEKSDGAFAVGLDEIAEDQNHIVIIEWSERLGDFRFRGKVLRIAIEGDGDVPRTVTIHIEKPPDAE